MPEYIRHRAGLPKRMTLNEFRVKYGENGVSEIITILVNNSQLDEKSRAGLLEIAFDIRSLLKEN